jgi:hypothetical protein
VLRVGSLYQLLVLALASGSTLAPQSVSAHHNVPRASAVNGLRTPPGIRRSSRVRPAREWLPRVGTLEPRAIVVPNVANLAPGDAAALATWTANGVDHAFSNDQFARALVVGVANRIVETRGLSPERARALGTALRAAEASVGQCRKLAVEGAPDAAAVSRCALRITSELPAVYRYQVTAEISEFFARMHYRSAGAVRRSDDAVTRARAFEEYASQELERGWSAARRDATVATVYEIGLGRALEATPGLAAAEILRRNPGMAAVVAEAPALSSALLAGQLPSKEALVQGFSTFVQSRTGVSGTLLTQGFRMLDTLGSSRDARRALVSGLSDERGMVRLTATLALGVFGGGPEAERASKLIATVGNAAVSLRSLYATAPALLATGQVATQLATFTTALGAASTVAAVLGGGGLGGIGGTNGVSRADIAALGDQIRAMHMEMTASFRRVDRKLDSLMAVTVAGFSAMQNAFVEADSVQFERFEGVHREIDRVQQQLTTVQYSLGRLLESFEAAAERDAVRDCRDYRLYQSAGSIEPFKWRDCQRAYAVGGTRKAMLLEDLPSLNRYDEFSERVVLELSSAARSDQHDFYPLLATVAANANRQAFRSGTVSLQRWANLSSAYMEGLTDCPTSPRIAQTLSSSS